MLYLIIAAIVAVTTIVYVKNVSGKLFGINWVSIRYPHNPEMRREATNENRAAIIALSVLIGFTCPVSMFLFLLYNLVNFIIKPKPNNNATTKNRNSSTDDSRFF